MNRSVRGLLLLLAAVLSSVAFLTPAQASEGNAVTPGDGSVLTTGPREIVVDPEASPDGEISVTLESAGGRAVQLTGEPIQQSGRVTVTPPVLEPGTYLVRWEYQSNGLERSGASSFSVSAPTALVSGTGEHSPAAPPAALAFALLGCLVAGATMALEWLRRRRASAAASVTAAVVAVAFSYLAQAGGVPIAPWLGFGAALVALGTIASVTWGGALVVAALAGAALGVMVVLDPPMPWLVTPVAVVGGAAAGLTIACMAALAISPRRTWERIRRRWQAPATAALLAPLMWGAVALSQSDGFATVPWLPLVGLGVLVAAAVPAVSALLAVWKGKVSAARAAAATATVMLVIAGGTLVQPAESVSVTPVEAVATISAEECASNPNRLEATLCLQALFDQKARASGVNPTLDELKVKLSEYPPLRFYCHETAHAIGRASLAVNKTVDAAFADGYDVCDFGYYHGIIEGAAGDMNDEEFEDAVPVLCRGLADVNQLFYMQCNHGLGHAAARRANNDLLRGLAFCDALERPESGLVGRELEGAFEACGTGVTMEWFATASAAGAADGQAVLPAVADLRDACTAVPDRWKAACVNYVGNTLDTSRATESLTEISQWCLTQAPAQKQCAEGVGRAASGVGMDAVDVIKVCDSAPPTRDACLEYFIASLATTIEYDAAAVDRVCALLPARDREGPEAMCPRLRQAAEEVLATGDGKSME